MNRTTTAVAALFLAIAGVAGVTGCAPTANRQSVGEVIDDATITARVKTALAKDDEVRSLQINVETFRGVVQLSGFVDTKRMADRAAAVARDVPGVSSVKNDLRLRSSAS